MKPPTPSATEADLGPALVSAIANDDLASLQALFAESVEFRALTPGRFWEVDSAAGAAELILGTWFGADTEVVQVAAVECTEVAGKFRVDYELRLRRGGHPATVAQTVYYGAQLGRIDSFRLLCSGILPTAE